MATNFEFYKDEILKIVNTPTRLAKVNGKPVTCAGTDCEECEFNKMSDLCDISTIKWLYAEHIEQPKLTKRERAFCEAVGKGWIARDLDNELSYFEEKPVKLCKEGYWVDDDNIISDSMTYLLPKVLEKQFSIIKWEDEKPWSIEDLLKLEVEDES